MKKIILILLVMALGPATAGLVSHAVAGYAGYKIGESKSPTTVTMTSTSTRRQDIAYCSDDSVAVLIQLDFENYLPVFFDRSCGKVVKMTQSRGCAPVTYRYMFPLDYIRTIYPGYSVWDCHYTITGNGVNITATARRSK